MANPIAPESKALAAYRRRLEMEIIDFLENHGKATILSIQQALGVDYHWVEESLESLLALNESLELVDGVTLLTPWFVKRNIQDHVHNRIETQGYVLLEQVSTELGLSRSYLVQASFILLY